MNVMILIKEQGVKIMKRNEFKALLAVSVIAVPLVFSTGCGKKTDNTAVEPTVQAEITATIEEQAETIEESVAESIPDVSFEEPDETLDESEEYAGVMYAVGEVSIFAEPSEDAEVIGTLSEGEEVSVLGILHEAEFYKVSTDTLEGYVRTVDLMDENGLYDEEKNSDTSDSSSSDSTYTQESKNSLPSSSNTGGLTDKELQAILEQGGFGDPSYMYDPSKDGGPTELDYDTTGGIPHKVQ